MEQLISLILPIYNVQEYLPRCLDSIVAQSYNSIEILLVNDGSTDQSGSICDSYAQKDSRISVIHIPNGGVAKARELGVTRAKGEFICFIDPDDYLPHNSIQLLHQQITPLVDLVIGSVEFDGGSISAPTLPNQEIERLDYVRLLLSRGHICYGSPWCKLYRASLFDSDSFPQFPRSQDWLMNLNLALNMSRIRLISQPVYTYCYHPSSVSHRKSYGMEYWSGYSQTIKDLLQKNGLYTQFIQQFHFMNLVILYHEFIIENVTLSLSQQMVKECYEGLKGSRLPLKYRVIHSSLKFKVLQYLLRGFRLINR